MQRVKVTQKPPAMLPVSQGTFMAPPSLMPEGKELEEVKDDGKSPGKAALQQD